MYLIYLPFIVFLVIIFLFCISKYKYNIGLHVMNLTYLFIYGLSGAYSYYSFSENKLLYINLEQSDTLFFFSYILVVISYFLSLIFYFYFFEKIKSFSFERINLKYPSIISLLFCFVFILIYIAQYGGLQNALYSAAAIRSGYGEVEDGSKLTFVKYLMPIGVFPFLYFSLQCINGEVKKNIILFLISASVLFLALILMSGRTRIVMYLLALVILTIYAKDGFKINLKKTILYGGVGTLSFIFITQGKKIFSSLEALMNGESLLTIMGENEKSSFLDSFLGYFAHRNYSNEMALQYFSDTNNLYWFKDNFYILFYLIPERLTGISKPESISYINTQNFTGIYDSTIPPGILAYGLYSLWIPGMFLMAILYSFLFSYFDKLNCNNKKNKVVLVFTLPCVLVWGMYGSVGDFRIIVNGFSYILFFIALIILFRFLQVVKK